jgi:hypothetical protein
MLFARASAARAQLANPPPPKKTLNGWSQRFFLTSVLRALDGSQNSMVCMQGRRPVSCSNRVDLAGASIPPQYLYNTKAISREPGSQTPASRMREFESSPKSGHLLVDLGQVDAGVIEPGGKERRERRRSGCGKTAGTWREEVVSCRTFCLLVRHN